MIWPYIAAAALNYAPAIAQIHRHTHYGPNGIKCTVNVYGNSSISDCTTPEDREMRQEMQAKINAEIKAKYLKNAEAAGIKPQCDLYARRLEEAMISNLSPHIKEVFMRTSATKESINQKILTCESNFANGYLPQGWHKLTDTSIQLKFSDAFDPFKEMPQKLEVK